MDKTKIAVNIFDKRAEEYQDKFMDVSLYHDSLDIFCEAIKKENAHILELACGPGNITKYLLNKRPDFKILGTDLSPKMIELAKINNPSAEFQIMDSRAIDKIEQKYDGIMCGFCLPYLAKEEAFKLIHDAANLLNTDGLIYLSTMEDAYSKSGFKGTSSNPEEQIYMYYHEADYLSAALLENSFKIISLNREVYIDHHEMPVKDLLIIAKI